jgi:hypothetical protein
MTLFMLLAHLVLAVPAAAQLECDTVKRFYQTTQTSSGHGCCDHPEATIDASSCVASNGVQWDLLSKVRVGAHADSFGYSLCHLHPGKVLDTSVFTKFYLHANPLTTSLSKPGRRLLVMAFNDDMSDMNLLTLANNAGVPCWDGTCIPGDASIAELLDGRYGNLTLHPAFVNLPPTGFKTSKTSVHNRLHGYQAVDHDGRPWIGEFVAAYKRYGMYGDIPGLYYHDEVANVVFTDNERSPLLTVFSYADGENDLTDLRLGTTAPAPSADDGVGDVYYDVESGIMYRYDGTAWVAYDSAVAGRRYMEFDATLVYDMTMARPISIAC